MYRETTTRIVDAVLEAMDRKRAGLLHELACLMDLGALAEEEAEALTASLSEFQGLLRRFGAPGPEHGTDLTELSGRLQALQTDIDLAYQRLCFTP